MTMDKNQEDIDFIERQLSGQLSQEELIDFETRIEEDREFARKYRLRKSFPSLFNATGDDMITQAVQEIQEENLREKRDLRVKALYLLLGIMLIVAVVVGILLFTGVISLRETKTIQETVAPAPVKPPVQKPAVKAQPPLQAPVTQKQEEQPSGEQAAIQNSGQSLVLESPPEGKIFSRYEEIVFQWKIDADTFTRLCVVSDISDRVIWWRGIIPGIQEYKVPANTFKAGTFRWYVGTNRIKRTFIIKE